MRYGQPCVATSAPTDTRTSVPKHKPPAVHSAGGFLVLGRRNLAAQRNISGLWTARHLPGGAGCDQPWGHSPSSPGPVNPDYPSKTLAD